MRKEHVEMLEVSYTIEQILSITNPCVLFSDTEVKIKEEYRFLSFNFHPDKNPDPRAGDVFAHINQLYYEVAKLIKSNQWESPTVLKLFSTDGKEYIVRFKKKKTFELGAMYISDTVVAYVLDNKYEKLFLNAQEHIKNVQFSSDNMKKEFGRYLPEIRAAFKTKDKCVLIVGKTKDLLLLSDVIEYYQDKFPVDWDKHVAWINSRLLNILCFLNYNKIVHHALSLDTIFISPEHHTVAVIGGWWYVVDYGRKMLSIPSNLYKYIPPTVLSTKKATNITDGELVKAIGRELLKKVKPPKAIENWFKFGAGESPIKEYETWQNKTLKEAYGERKFVALDLKVEDIYHN